MLKTNQVNSTLLEEEIILREIGKMSCELLHDLISPISGLTLYLETFGNKDLKNLLIPVNKTSDDIRNFIEVVREATNNPNKIEVINTKKLILNVASLLRHKAINNEIKILIIQETDNVLIMSNKLKIYQMMINLIINSIDAFDKIKNNDHKTISIFISYEESLNITVVDNAGGIAENDIQKIFIKNFTTKEKGFGLGLANTKKIVEKDLEGKISVESSPDNGTKFKITINPKYVISCQ